MENVVPVYAPIGRIDSGNAASVEAEVMAKLNDGASSMIIDLTGVDYLSSAGLRVLLLIAKTCRARSGKAVIQQAAPAVSEVLKISGFDKIIPMVQSREDALRAVAA